MFLWTSFYLSKDIWILLAVNAEALCVYEVDTNKDVTINRA